MQTFSDTTMAEARERGVGMIMVKPWIMPHHIDGPLLHFSDGQLHWLTLWERIQYRLGLVGPDQLQRKLRPRLTAELFNHQ